MGSGAGMPPALRIVYIFKEHNALMTGGARTIIVVHNAFHCCREQP